MITSSRSLILGKLTFFPTYKSFFFILLAWFKVKLSIKKHKNKEILNKNIFPRFNNIYFIQIFTFVTLCPPKKTHFTSAVFVWCPINGPTVSILNWIHANLGSICEMANDEVLYIAGLVYTGSLVDFWRPGASFTMLT